MEELIGFLTQNTLLGLDFTEQELTDFFLKSKIDLQKAIINVKKENWICQEGDPIEKLSIPLNCDLSLYSESSKQAKIKMGEVSPGRSLNLYSVLRSQPFQYSAQANADGMVFQLPILAFDELLNEKYRLKDYLFAMTGSNEIRQIAKELDSLGCGSKFKFNFISSIKAENISPHTWLHIQGELAKCSFMICLGDVEAFKTVGSEYKKVWTVPQRTWLLWNDVIMDSKDSVYSYQTASTVHLFKINKIDIEKLKQNYPDDFLKLSQWLRGEKLNFADSDDDEQEIDVRSIFKNTLEAPKKLFNKYPWVEQNDMMDCGPACLAMISKYYGKNVSIQFWRTQLSTNKEGTSLFDLAKSAEKNGFISHGVALDSLNDLDRSLLPIIVLRRYHYMVLYKIEKDGVILGDPSVGISKIPFKEFYDGFEKVALLLKPLAAFNELPESRGSYGHYLQLFNGVGHELILALGASFLITLMSLFPPLLSQIIMDEVLSKKDYKLLLMTLAAAVVVVSLNSFMLWARSYYVGYITSKFDFKSKSSFIHKMMSLPYSYFATRHVGDFTRRMTELERVRNFFTNSFLTLFLNLSSLIVYFGILMFYSLKIATIVLLMAPVFILISMFFSRKLSSLYAETFNTCTDLESYMTDVIKGMSTIKALGAEMASRWRYEEILVKSLKSRYKFNLNAIGMFVISDAYFQFSKYAVMGAAVYIAIAGDLSPGQVIAIAMIVGQVFLPFFQIAEHWAEIQEMKVIFNRLNDVFLSKSENRSTKAPVKKDKLIGDIEFLDVWFRYGGDSSDWILKGVSFKISAGHNVAIVGPSGSGKSTIAYLLMRLYEPNQGQIFIDGRDYRDYDIDWLRVQLGLLHQETHLFGGTLMENIAIGSPEIDENLVVESAKKAACDEFIQKKPGAYDYHVTHGGFGLSVGEKQRVAIARTFYHQPSIIIFDEATAALDGISENELLTNIKKHLHKTTIINIAHRHSTVLMSDLVLVLSEGKVVGFGTHEDLARTHVLYQKMFCLSVKSEAAA